MTHKIARYGWLPDLPDHRDFTYSLPATLSAKLPPSVDLREHCPPVYDQGNIGSCTANAIAGSFEFEMIKQKVKSIFIPSRLFIYYNERVIEHTVDTDSGAMIRDGIKSINKDGVCPETMFPYDVAKFTQKPSVDCYSAAKKHKALLYSRIDRKIEQMKGCIAEGYPFVFGFAVYAEFESQQVAKTGIVNLPAPAESPVGGHAVLAVGYDDNSGRFIVRNSWGESWGMKGYFTMPYGYLINSDLSDDFWSVRLVANAPALSKNHDENK